MKRTKNKNLSRQVRVKVSKKPSKKQEYDGDVGKMISTGSTLLDLAISGGRVRGGGMPAGILVEIFGPASSGKTVLLSEIAGAIQRQKGEVMFHDPEARLNKQFARIFDLDTEEMNYGTPNTVPEVFKAVREWEPESKNINGIFADSLAALSTDTEMDKEEGDKMGMRRAKKFSEECRKTCRVLAKNNYLMVCSNQIRQNLDAGPYGPKYKSPGGEAIGFYSSLRLRMSNPKKIKETRKVSGKEVMRVVGVKMEVEVFKSSVWKPYRTAPITILFDYGIDNIRDCLQFIKDYTKNTTYCLGDNILSNEMNKAVKIIEEKRLEHDLKETVITLWETIESKFETERKPKIR